MQRLLEQLLYSTSSLTKMHMELVCKQNNENIVDI